METLPSLMTWNWQKPDWPHFSQDKTHRAKPEERFLLETCVFAATVKHLRPEDREQVTVQVPALTRAH
jgi:hypothetical protein